MVTTSYLSDNQRRVVCRLVFLIGCVLPTAILVYLLLHQWSPDDWERWIQAELGIHVEIAEVQTPRPGQILFRGVRLSETVPGVSTQADELTIEEICVKQTKQGGLISIVHPVHLPIGVMPEVVKQCSEKIQALNMGDWPWQIDFSKILLIDPTTGQAELVMQPAMLAIETIAPTAEDDPGCLQIRLLTKLAADDPENLLSVVYQRSPRQKTVEIETQGSVPCRLLEPWQRDLRWLGQSSRFRGNVRLTIDEDHRIDGTVAGELTQIALDQLARAYELPLRGSCRLSAIDCRIENNQIDYARFKVTSSRPGMIGRSFLEAAGSLGIRYAIDPEANALTFHRVGFDVRIKDGNFTLAAVNNMMAGNAAGDPVISCAENIPVPVHYLAILLTGEKTIGSRSVALLNRFRIPAERMADGDIDGRSHF